jgi:hypothetical protein
MKTPVIATILLVLAVPVFAADDYNVLPPAQPADPFAFRQLRVPKDWSIFYNVRIATDETFPLFYWQDFDTAEQCLAKLQELRERVDKDPAAYSGYSDMRCGKTETYVAPERYRKKPN